MSYECKHVIRYKDENLNNKEGLEKLNEVMDKACQYGKFVMAKDHSCLSDSNWNSGFGLTWYDQDYDMENVAKGIKEDLECIALDENNGTQYAFAIVTTLYDEDGRYNYYEQIDDEVERERFMKWWNQTINKTITVPLTVNGEITLNGAIIPKETVEEAVKALNESLKYKPSFGHFRKPGQDPLVYAGFSHQINTLFKSETGEFCAEIETLHTPEGTELKEDLDRIIGNLEHQDRYEFKPCGFLEKNGFTLTSLDVVQKPKK